MSFVSKHQTSEPVSQLRVTRTRASLQDLLGLAPIATYNRLACTAQGEFV